jgi:hypothetical protein
MEELAVRYHLMDPAEVRPRVESAGSDRHGWLLAYQVAPLVLEVAQEVLLTDHPDQRAILMQPEWADLRISEMVHSDPVPAAPATVRDIANAALHSAIVILSREIGRPLEERRAP